MLRIHTLCLLCGCLSLAAPCAAAAQPPEGTESAVELPEVAAVDGHPIRAVLPPDMIRALDEPPTAAARDARFMDPRERVIGVVQGGVARAYPLRQLDWHEVINDRLGGRPIAVTW